MLPLRGVVVIVTKHKTEILCENGNRVTTTRTKNFEFGVEVEIFMEIDTTKITKIRRINPDRELVENNKLEKINKKVETGDISDQDYYDRVGGLLQTNESN